MTPEQLLTDFVAPLQRLKKSAAGYTASCPVDGHAHGDRNPSLAVYIGESRILTHCYSALGHTWEDVYSALGYGADDWKLKASSDSPAILDTYNYTDESGDLLYQVVRYVPKTFRQRRPEGNGWSWKLGDVRRVLYRLPEVAAETGRVVVVEGEKDVETLRSLGYVATTGMGGAQNWKDEWADQLAHVSEVVIIPDSDDQGAKYAARIRRSLQGKGPVVKVVPLQSHKDIADLVFASGDNASAVVESLLAGQPTKIEAVEEPSSEWLPTKTADTWMFTHTEGIDMLITQISPSSRGLHAWVEIRWRGTVPASGLVVAARFDLMGSRTVGSMVARIKEAGIDPKTPDWRHLIQQAVYDVIQDYLGGPEVVDLTRVDPTAATFVLRPLIGGVGATSLVGAGGVGKSLLGLACACAVGSGDDSWVGMKVMRPGPAVYVDWEADKDTHALRLAALSEGVGKEVPQGQLHYIEAEAPLSMWAPALARQVAKIGASLVVIDSVMLARGGEAAAADTIAFFAALRALGCPTLLIDHQSREALENNKTSSFGSIINDNSARLRWVIRGDQQAITLRNVKANNFGRLPAINLRLDNQIQGDQLKSARWVHVDPPPPRGGTTESLLQALADHPAGLYVSEIEKIIGKDSDSFRRILYRLAEGGKIEKIDHRWFLLVDPY